MKRAFKVGTGKVVYQLTKTKTDDGKLIISESPVFRGKPEDQGRLLMRAHTPSGAIALIDKLGSDEVYWTLMRKYISNRIKALSEKKV